MTGQDWKALEARWDKGIDVNLATYEDLNSYIETKVHFYEEDNTTNSNLWELYQDDFQNFTTATFKTSKLKVIQRLRDCLLSRGVFVTQNTNRLTISQALYNCAQEEEQHEWSDDDVINAAERLDEPLRSTKLKRRLENIQADCTSVEKHKYESSEVKTEMTSGLQVPLQPKGSKINMIHPPSPQTDDALESVSQTPSLAYVAQISSLIKAYAGEPKYEGTGDSIDYKLTCFFHLCDLTGVPKEAYPRALSVMLKGFAKEHYLAANLSQLTFKQAVDHLRNFFEGPGYNRRNLGKWNGTTLKLIMSENKAKSTSECLQILVQTLREIQHGLTEDLRTNSFMHDKIITACQGVPACRYAIANPPTRVGELLNHLQNSIIAYEEEEKQNQGTLNQGVFFTDRRYHQTSQGRATNYDAQNKRCYICGKKECRSWKHSDEERRRSKSKFKASLENKLGHRFVDNNRFQKRYRQFMVDCEGYDTPSTEDDEFEDAFNALEIEIQGDYNESKEKDETDAFLTSYGEINHTAAGSAMEEMVANLSNRSFVHALTTTDSVISTSHEVDPFVYTTSPPRYTSENFMGIMIDTGASKRSTAGYGQYEALHRITANGVNLDERDKGLVNVQFGIGSTSSIGSIKVDTPIGRIEFHVVKADTPFLLCLADLDKLNTYFNNLTNNLVTPHRTVPVVRRFGHPFMLWNNSLSIYISNSFNQCPCYLTDIELKRLHRRFGHPSVERLHRILERSGHGDENHRKVLEEITRFCTHCQKYGRSPGRFKFTLKNDVQFNYCIFVDIMYIDGNPLLHVVDEGTRFQAGRWLKNISAKHTWDVLRNCWIDTYLGPPDLISHDAGKNFVSKEFQQYAINVGSTTKGLPVESHNSVGLVERYHGPLRRIYQIITKEIPGIDKNLALQMTFKALNDSVGPDGLVPTLLVFGAYPRMVEADAPSPTVTERTKALRKAMKELEGIRANRQVNDALKMRNGPSTTAIHALPLNSLVLVWREGNTNQLGNWTGPYKLLNINGETCTLELPSGPTEFRSTSVKPYLTEPSKPNANSINDRTSTVALDQSLPEANPLRDNALQAGRPKRQGVRPRRYATTGNVADITVYFHEGDQFKESRRKEIAGLIEKGVFEIVEPNHIPVGTRVFSSKFVDEVKYKGTIKAFEKSRLVVQAYNDTEKDSVLTQSPTIQRVSQRLILCLASSIPNTNLYLRDISQAYVQSTTNLNRDFYIRPPYELSTELGLEKGTLLKVVKPLYGIPEAGNHWFRTYHNHHTKELCMNGSTFDPCLLWCHNSDQLGIVGLQTDDTLFLANDSFASAEQNKLDKAKFPAKEREKLAENHPLGFNGCMIKIKYGENTLTLTQERQCKNLSLVAEVNATSTSSRGSVRTGLSTKEQYVAQRARGAYIASMCQPEASFDLSFAAQVTNPQKDDISALNKRLQWQKTNEQRGLNFVELDIETLRLYAFTDASFANNKDYSSQIGFVLVLADATYSANIIHWSSVKCKRVTRSVLASELYAMVHGFDIGAAVKSTVEQLTQTNVPLILCTDSRSLYDCLVKLGTTQEKRLMIDLMCLRQSYERREITEVIWIDGNSNPADSMTKSKPSTALQRLIDTNRLQLNTMEWVQRTDND